MMTAWMLARNNHLLKWTSSIVDIDLMPSFQKFGAVSCLTRIERSQTEISNYVILDLSGRV